MEIDKWRYLYGYLGKWSSLRFWDTFKQIWAEV